MLVELSHANGLLEGKGEKDDNELDRIRQAVTASIELEKKILSLERDLGGKTSTEGESEQMVGMMKENLRKTTDLLNASYRTIDHLRTTIDNLETQKMMEMEEFNDQMESLKKEFLKREAALLVKVSSLEETKKFSNEDKQKTILSLEKKISVQQQTEESLRAEIEKLTHASKDLESTVLCLENELALQKQIESSLRIDIQSLTQNMEERMVRNQEELDKIRNEKYHYKRKAVNENVLEKLMKENSTLRQRIEAITASFEKSRSFVEQLKQEISLQSKSHHTLQNQFAKLSEESTKRESELKQRIIVLENAKKQLECDADLAHATIKSLDGSRENEKNKIRSLKEGNNEKSSAEVLRLKDELRRSKDLITKSKIVIDKLSQDHEEQLMRQKEQKNNLESKLIESRRIIHSLENALSSQKKVTEELRLEIKKLIARRNEQKRLTRQEDENDAWRNSEAEEVIVTLKQQIVKYQKCNADLKEEIHYLRQKLKATSSLIDDHRSIHSSSSVHSMSPYKGKSTKDKNEGRGKWMR